MERMNLWKERSVILLYKGNEVLCKVIEEDTTAN